MDKKTFEYAGCLNEEIEEIKKMISHGESTENEIIFTEPYDAFLTILCC